MNKEIITNKQINETHKLVHIYIYTYYSLLYTYILYSVLKNTHFSTSRG